MVIDPVTEARRMIATARSHRSKALRKLLEPAKPAKKETHRRGRFDDSGLSEFFGLRPASE
jgi:hypothetical protein